MSALRIYLSMCWQLASDRRLNIGWRQKLMVAPRLWWVAQVIASARRLPPDEYREFLRFARSMGEKLS